MEAFAESEQEDEWIEPLQINFNKGKMTRLFEY